MAYVKNIFDRNFLEYASYVIKDRAIPDLEDGLKPVQRRILHSLFEMDDGKFHKVANDVGHCMKYHPHGDASIGAALVVLANKDLFIDRQGNFGNIFTGDDASAPRYIECRITPLAKDVFYNPKLTNMTDSYDGRNKEPVLFPAKIPVVLIMGAEGIAVGMSTKILPHNIIEILEAEKAVLGGKKVQIYPDFPTGGLIDVSDYKDGNGKVLVRAKLDVSDPKRITDADIDMLMNTSLPAEPPEGYSLMHSTPYLYTVNGVKQADLDDDVLASEVQAEVSHYYARDDFLDIVYSVLTELGISSICVSAMLSSSLWGSTSILLCRGTSKRKWHGIASHARQSININANTLNLFVSLPPLGRKAGQQHTPHTVQKILWCVQVLRQLAVRHPVHTHNPNRLRQPGVLALAGLRHKKPRRAEIGKGLPQQRVLLFHHLGLYIMYCGRKLGKLSVMPKIKGILLDIILHAGKKGVQLPQRCGRGKGAVILVHVQHHSFHQFLLAAVMVGQVPHTNLQRVGNVPHGDIAIALRVKKPPRRVDDFFLYVLFCHSFVLLYRGRPR